MTYASFSQNLGVEIWSCVYFFAMALEIQGFKEIWCVSNCWCNFWPEIFPMKKNECRVLSAVPFLINGLLKL